MTTAASSTHLETMVAFVNDVEREVMVDHPGDFFFDVFDTQAHAKYCDRLSVEDMQRGFWSVFRAGKRAAA